jgi:hypothetical protein
MRGKARKYFWNKVTSGTKAAAHDFALNLVRRVVDNHPSFGVPSTSLAFEFRLCNVPVPCVEE